MKIIFVCLGNICRSPMAEAMFKGFGKALDMATMDEPRMKEAWTTKGAL